MIKDDILDYWTEAVKSSLEEMNKLHLFTNDDIKEMAETMVISAEQESMAFGYDAIPNPLTTEINRIKEENAQEIDDWKRRDRIYCQSIADAYNLSARDMIYIENGEVKCIRR